MHEGTTRRWTKKNWTREKERTEREREKRKIIMRSYAKLLNVLQTPINFVITYYGYYEPCIGLAYCFIPFARWSKTIHALRQWRESASNEYCKRPKQKEMLACRNRNWHPSSRSYCKICFVLWYDNARHDNREWQSFDRGEEKKITRRREQAKRKTKLVIFM